MLRRSFLTALVAVAAVPAAHAQKPRPATLYKNPDCDCCDEYAKYLRQHGFEVEVIATPELDRIKKSRGVPEALAGCHTTLVGTYVVEGHVPVKSIERLLREKPKITGISLPGMPAGSPGMSGKKEAPFTMQSFGGQTGGKPQIYSVE